ncbi:MAG: alpha/beta hydrolase [Bdellovibrionota bacterium]
MSDKKPAEEKPPTTWVCLRGLGRGQFHWGEFKGAMEAAKPGDKFFWLEYPGNGERFREQSPWNIDDYVQDLRRQLSAAKNQGGVTVLAVSFGGMIATRWAELYPNEIDKLVLINTSSGADQMLHRLQKSAWLTMVQIVWASLSPPAVAAVEVEKHVLKMTLSSPEKNQFYIKAWASYMKSHPVSPRSFAAQLWAAKSAKFPDYAPVPVHLVVSKNDRMVSPQCMQSLAERWEVPITEHPWGGHDLPLDDPRGLIKIIEETT